MTAAMNLEGRFKSQLFVIKEYNLGIAFADISGQKIMFYLNSGVVAVDFLGARACGFGKDTTSPSALPAGAKRVEPWSACAPAGSLARPLPPWC